MTSECKQDENLCIYCYCFEMFSLGFINIYLCAVYVTFLFSKKVEI